MITPEQFESVAALLGCEVAAIRAVAEVESKGSGFLADGRVKILFEPHIFWRELVKAGINPSDHVAGNEDILYQKWKSGAYGPESAQWGRLTRAAAIDKEAAYKSASWGRFQLMGFNHLPCGYSSAVVMANDMATAEDQQLAAFANFIKNEGMAGYLQRKAWADFALRYNGPAYKENNYDRKLADAYGRFSK